MYANISISYHPKNNIALKKQNINEILDNILKNLQNKKIFIVALLIERKKETHHKLLEN